MYDWDETKRTTNLAKHGVDFADVESLDWTRAQTREDMRGNYGEPRFVTTAPIGDRLHICIWTPRNDVIREIGLRKANPREQRRYEQHTQKLH